MASVLRALLGGRLLSGIEVMNGILLVGWTTALLFAVAQRSCTMEFGE